MLEAFGSYLKLKRTQLNLIIGDKMLKDINYDEWMDKASQMLLASSASKSFHPFSIPWVKFLNTPAVKFLFVSSIRIDRVISRKYIIDREEIVTGEDIAKGE